MGDCSGYIETGSGALSSLPKRLRAAGDEGLASPRLMDTLCSPVYTWLHLREEASESCNRASLSKLLGVSETCWKPEETDRSVSSTAQTPGLLLYPGATLCWTVTHHIYILNSGQGRGAGITLARGGVP